MSFIKELEEFRRKRRSQIPKDYRSVVDGFIADLLQSDAASRVVKVGETAPRFALPNQHGTMVDSEALLSNGPLVVTFYRGGW